jgi:hypothetical protein
LAQARALADRCGERVERAHAVAVGELAAFGSADRARLRYGR